MSRIFYILFENIFCFIVAHTLLCDLSQYWGVGQSGVWGEHQGGQQGGEHRPL